MTDIRHYIDLIESGFLVENTKINFIDEFWSTRRKKKAAMSKRDMCGPTACEFISFLESKEIFDAKRVWGVFIADKPVHSFRDFTREQCKQMKAVGLNQYLDTDRVEYMISNNLVADLCRLPHYWVVVNGQIFDPVGEYQFIKSGLAHDLDSKRYVIDDVSHYGKIFNA